MNLAIERPLVVRDYETNWDIPEEAIRVNVSSADSYRNSLNTFCLLLIRLAESSKTTVFETFDVYTPIEKWSIAKDRRLIEIENNEDVAKAITHTEDLAKVIIARDEAYTSTECRSHEFGPILKEVYANELIFTFFDRDVPVPPMFSDPFLDDRFERLYLESLSQFRCVSFLSRDHVHMEITTIKPPVLLEIEQVISEVGYRQCD